eukprot:gene3968-4519_t
MRRQLKIAVKHELFDGVNVPPTSNRRYFPNHRIIKSHMVHVNRKLRHSMIDQDCLEVKVQQWRQEQPSSKIFYRPKQIGVVDLEIETTSEENEDDEEMDVKSLKSNGGGFLFMYHSEEQRRLLSRYGNEIAFLDATCRTTCYTLPLFFLVVKTNVDYQIAGAFVTENEDTDSIKEAMAIIKKWNPEFEPKYFMTDYSNEEINAIEDSFRDCTVFICDFHREQAWERWLSKSANGCRDVKNDVLEKLRQVARSRSVNSSESAIARLKSSIYWKDEKYIGLVEYIERYWLNVKKRWILAYRQERLLLDCNTNNRTERQNESFKFQYLQKHTRKSATGMLSLLIEIFLSINMIIIEDIRRKFQLSCKIVHIIWYGTFHPAWSWEAFPSYYKNSVFLTLDEKVVVHACPAINDDERSHTEDAIVAEIPDCEYLSDGTDSASEHEDSVPKVNKKEPVVDHRVGKQVRDYLADIRRMTFLIEDKPDIMKDLSQQLRIIREKLYNCMPREKGMILRSELIDDYQRKQSKICSKTLRLHKRKCKFAGRVEEKKEKYSRASVLKVSR